MWQRRGVGLPAVGLRRVEVDVLRGAGGVVRIEHGLDRPLADELAGDAGGDPLAGHVGEHLVFELRRIGAAFADEVAVEPLLGDALELPEEVELRVFAWVAPLVSGQGARSVRTRPARAARRRCERD